MKKLVIILLLLFPVSGYAAEFYTAATARTQVRAILNETTASFWTNDEIDAWIKEAVEDISARAGGFQVSDTITLSTGAYEYATTTGSVSVADIVEVLGMVYVVTTDITGDTNQRFIGLIRVDPTQIGSLPLTDNGPPKYYYHAGDKIGILPPPTATENSQVVRIYFTKTSQTIADLPNQYQSLTFWYAAAMAYKKEHRYAESKELYAMYLQKLSNLSKTTQAGKK
jgi:hypothetical protein